MSLYLLGRLLRAISGSWRPVQACSRGQSLSSLIKKADVLNVTVSENSIRLGALRLTGYVKDWAQASTEDMFHQSRSWSPVAPFCKTGL